MTFCRPRFGNHSDDSQQSKSVDQRQVVIDEPVSREDTSVERRPMNRVVAADEVPKRRQEDHIVIFPVLEKVLVVEKRLLLKEEVRINRARRTDRDQLVTTRAEWPVVQRLAKQGDRRPDGGSLIHGPIAAGRTEPSVQDAWRHRGLN
jgi:stress response protein YsnF